MLQLYYDACKAGHSHTFYFLIYISNDVEGFRYLTKTEYENQKKDDWQLIQTNSRKTQLTVHKSETTVDPCSANWYAEEYMSGLIVDGERYNSQVVKYLMKN